VAYYPIQSPGGKVTSTAHRLTPDWQVVADHQSPRAAWVVREQEAVRGDQRRLIWSWFSVAGSRVPTLSQAKLHEMLGILNGDRSGAVFAVSAVCRDTCDDAAHRLEDFLTYSGEALHQLSDTNPVREL
jgi:EpsI family protein